tara:strand:- start:87 stop:2597 length:2511 start_codon:yes stop_codon:yes gene_type:complete
MSGFPIGNQIKPNIQLQLFDRINSMNRTDENRNPLSTISKEIESNPYSEMLTKSCWVRVSGTTPTYEKDEDGKFIRPLKTIEETPLQLRSDFENGQLINRPITSKTNLLNNTPTSNLRAGVGVTGITTQFKNHSIQNITINWKMYDPDDFEVYEKSFLKHGRTVLVEFGWSVPGIEFNTLKNVNDMFSYYSALEEKILQGGGNYNAAIGTIKNFSWTVGPNGEYDCTTELTSMGNTLFKGTQDPGDNVLEVTKKKNEQLLSEAFREAGERFDLILENLNDILRNTIEKKPTLSDKIYYNEIDNKSYCTWGYFEDKVLNRFFAVASKPNVDISAGYEGLLTYIQSTDESYEMETGSDTDEPTFTAVSGDNVCRWHKNLFTIGKDIIIPEKVIGLTSIKDAGGENSQFDNEDTRNAYNDVYQTFSDIQKSFKPFKVDGEEYGVIRNFVFSADFLAKQFKGIRDIESGLQSFWSNVTARYGGFWDFGVFQSQTKNGKIAVVDRFLTKFRIKDTNPFRVEGKKSTYESLDASKADAKTVFVFPLYNNRGLFKDFSITVNMSSAMATQAMFHSNTDYKTSGFGGSGAPENKGVVALAKLHNTSVSANPNENAGEDGLLKEIFFPFIKGLSVKTVEDEDGKITYELGESEDKGEYYETLQKKIDQENKAADAQSRLDDKGSRWLTDDEIDQPQKAGLVYDRNGNLLPSFVRGMQWYLNKGPESKTSFDPLTPLQCSFTMPGIAGIKMYDVFAVDYLPELYRRFGMFMVTSMNHTLSPQGWDTQIQGNLRVDMEGLEEYAKEINAQEEVKAFDGERGSKVEEILKNENDKIAEQKAKSATSKP